MTPEFPYITRGAQRRIEILALVLGLLLAGFVLLGAYTAYTAHHNCVRVDRLEVVIQQQGRRALKTLGKPGGVGFAYYQTHPAELAVARQQLRDQINDFTPSRCSGPF